VSQENTESLRKGFVAGFSHGTIISS